MKSAILFAVVTGVLGQNDAVPKASTPPPPKGAAPQAGFPGILGALTGNLAVNCSKEPTPDNLDPMIQFPAVTVQWPCDFGKSVPYGKVPTGCAKFEVLVARGTSEVGQFGVVVGDPLIARLIKAMPGQNVRGYPVQYPAGGTDLLPKLMGKLSGGGKGLEAVTEMIDAGPRDIINRISSQMKDCPDERFALVGYSQGGAVISAASFRLTPQMLEKVDAVVSYGSVGIFPQSLTGKWLNNCAPGDFCGGNPGTEGHLSYNNEGTIWHDRSAKYIADAFNGKPQGQIFAKTSRN